MAITRLASSEPTTAATTFSGISGDYKCLYVFAQTKCDETVSGADQNSLIYMTFNGDTAANYYRQVMYVYHTAYGGYNGAGSTNSNIFWESANSYGSYAGWSAAKISIPDYAVSGTNHACQLEATTISETSNEGISNEFSGFAWSGTAAITSITFTSEHSTFTDGTQFVLYGLEV